MKTQKKNLQKEKNENSDKNIPNPDDSLKPVNKGNGDPPEIYKISKRGNSLDRKDFFKSAASVAGLAALGTILNSCQESKLDIERDGDNCTCHAVCACNTEGVDESSTKGAKNESLYDSHNICTCDMVCTCNTVCSCDTVCTCNSQGGGGGGGGSYWYPC
jgi:hypothetical protein